MSNLKTNYQKSSDSTWIDEQGVSIPYNRINASERFNEKKSNQLLKMAMKINGQLTSFKNLVNEACAEAYQKFLEVNNVDPKDRKGHHTWYNFDRSIKVEVSVKDRIAFDELGIAACKDKLNEFLEGNIDSADKTIKKMVMDAFETSRGNLDANKVLSLLKYKKSIKNKNFQEAMRFLEDSIRHPSSKTYFRIWAMDEDGAYQNIDLNFSSIKTEK